MLPGGMVPVRQLVAIVRSTPPRGAAGLLVALPADRLRLVISELSPADIARLLPAAPAHFREMVIDLLSAEQLSGLLRTNSTGEAVGLLVTLSHERLSVLVDGLPDQVVALLLESLPAERQVALLEVMDPHRGRAVLSGKYEHEVAGALARANFCVTVPDGAPSGILLVQGLGWRIVVAVRYDDDGRTGVRDAEEGAFRLRANGALSVTDRQPASEVVQYCQESRRQGRPVDAVAWIDSRYDGSLKRTLVALCQ
jgi:hypothetical protein